VLSSDTTRNVFWQVKGRNGNALAAYPTYVSVFDHAEIVSIHRYQANESGAEGAVVHATFSLCGQVFMCMDSNVKHDFTFTPSISLYVACATEEEIDRLFEKLSQGGTVAMPLAAYPFSEKFAWVADKYGVSWQLNLERN
jgi:predicted 3-demethylubiquinone-9 3-methyltransferase (glyoxalase superfamily)